MGNVPPINGNRLGLGQTNTHTNTHGGYHGRSAGRSKSSIVSTTICVFLSYLGSPFTICGPQLIAKLVYKLYGLWRISNAL